MISDEELQKINEEVDGILKEQPPSSGYWSGCNCYVNCGENHHEPKGTATSMHDCDDCNNILGCLLKQTTRIFRYNQKEFDRKWEDTALHRR